MFNEAIKRIKQVTGKEKQKDLCAEIGITPQNYRIKERKEDFDANWAFRVSQKYGVSTDWILTGKGPKNFGEQEKPKNDFVLLIDKWVIELKKDDPEREGWFKFTFIDSFPKFATWLKDRKIKEVEQRTHGRQPQTVREFVD